jgi:hypothetical protein
MTAVGRITASCALGSLLLATSELLAQSGNASVLDAQVQAQAAQPQLFADDLVAPCQSLATDRHRYREQLLSIQADNRFAGLQGLEIGRVSFVRLDVFDTELSHENNILYRWVNRLHLRTRESTLKAQLLFRPGDRLDPQKLYETERNLRARSYLSQAFVMPEARCGNHVDVVVVTQDAWTTQPIFTASRAGGESEARFGLVEGNVAGTGAQVSVQYEKGSERNRLAYGFKKDYLFKKPYRLELGYSENTDGANSYLALSKPFYTQDTPWASEVRAEQLAERLQFEWQDQLLAAYDREAEAFSISVARQKGRWGDYRLRWHLGLSREQEQFDEFVGQEALAPRTLGDITYSWVGLSWVATRFAVLKNLNSIERLEDIPLGSQGLVTVGLGDTTTGEPLQVWTIAQTWTRLQPEGIWRWGLEGEGRESDQTSYALHMEGDYRYFWRPQHQLGVTARYDRAKPLGLHQALRLGGFEGVRGYPASWAYGDERLGASAAYWYFSPRHFWSLMRLGATAYVDVAQLRNGAFSLPSDLAADRVTFGPDEVAGRWLHSVGFGLRLTSSKTRIGNVVHIDVAFPTAYREQVGRYEILLRAEKYL